MEAARELFAERTIETATIDEIVTAAGVAKGTSMSTSKTSWTMAGRGRGGARARDRRPRSASVADRPDRARRRRMRRFPRRGAAPSRLGQSHGAGRLGDAFGGGAARASDRGLAERGGERSTCPGDAGTELRNRQRRLAATDASGGRAAPFARAGACRGGGDIARDRRRRRRGCRHRQTGLRSHRSTPDRSGLARGSAVWQKRIQRKSAVNLVALTKPLPRPKGSYEGRDSAAP